MKIKYTLICGTLAAAAIGMPLAMPNTANAARIWGPAVYSVSPNSGPTIGGTTVTVTGNDLTMATAVTFGGVPASFTIVSNTEIIAVSPAESAGTVVVKAIDPPNPGLGGANFTYS